MSEDAIVGWWVLSVIGLLALGGLIWVTGQFWLGWAFSDKAQNLRWHRYSNNYNRTSERVGVTAALIALGGPVVVTAALLVFAAICLIYESTLPPARGPVLGKRHREAYTSTTMVKSGSAFVPIVQHHPEAWYLTVEDDGGERGVSVSEETFARYEIGDHYEPAEEKHGD